MSDLSPLQQAQTLLQDLQDSLEKQTLASLRSTVSQLTNLLQQVDQPSSTSSNMPTSVVTVTAPVDESEQVAALRKELDDFIQQSASFTSLMVHEIRKPMTSIRGYTDMLAKPGLIGPLNEMQQNFVDIIRNNVIRMDGLVTDISDMNKLTSQRIRLENKLTTLGQVMLEVKKLAEGVIAECEQQVNWEIPQGLPPLNTDTKQLAKVIYNLVRNACQYTPKGTGNIYVTAEALGDDQIRISVADNGIGMSPEEQSRLGEPFYRADHELVTNTKGYGLGLPVAMGFLKLMNSHLDVQSSPDQGSTFSFAIYGGPVA